MQTNDRENAYACTLGIQRYDEGRQRRQSKTGERNWQYISKHEIYNGMEREEKMCQALGLRNDGDHQKNGEEI